jgi:hypothetical protein
MFAVAGWLYVAEFKPTFRQLLRKNARGESDIEKVERLVSCLKNGEYAKQLLDNFGLNLSEFFGVRPCVGYAGAPAPIKLSLWHVVIEVGGVNFYRSTPELPAPVLEN